MDNGYECPTLLRKVLGGGDKYDEQIGARTRFSGKKTVDKAIRDSQRKSIQQTIASTKAPPARKRTKSNKKKGAKTNKKKGAKNNKKKGAKKKTQLGGVRTGAPVTKPSPLKWWQVCACVFTYVLYHVRH